MADVTQSAAAPVPDMAAGVAFAGRYRIAELLGEGDRKRTYLALDTNIERKVALSLIKAEAARSDPAGTKREVEILCLAGSHDNIVTLHDSGVFEGTEYLVLEFLPGGTLRDYLGNVSGRDRRVPVGDVMRFGRQMTRALSHVHQRGLIHRDIAPANIWTRRARRGAPRRLRLGDQDRDPARSRGAASDDRGPHLA